MEGPILEQFVKKYSLWEEFMLDKVMEDCVPWEGSYTDARAECEESSPEEEGMPETCDELTTTPIPYLSALQGGKKIRSEVKPRKKEAFC
ncbi:hypothetical protein BTVI_12178 [Pitangus sulphuratus]|nr:hypothetical protein BTVI_12178 [Pitangus sulphuratus]